MHTIPKSLEQLQADTFPLECCEGAAPVVEVYYQPHFLSGISEGHVIRCSKCLKVVKPSTRTTLRP